MADINTVDIVEAVAEVMAAQRPFDPPPEESKMETVTPPVKVKKFDFLLTAGPTLIELTKAAPGSDHVRALLLARFGTLVPEGIKEYDKVVEWVEENGCKPYVPPAPLPPIHPAPERGRNIAFSIEYDFSDTEIGTCNYSVCREGSAEHAITEERLRDLVQNNDSIDDIVSEITDMADEDPWELDPEMDSGDMDHDNYQHSETIDANWDRRMSDQRIAQRVREWCEGHLDEEELQRLGLRE